MDAYSYVGSIKGKSVTGRVKGNVRVEIIHLIIIII